MSDKKTVLVVVPELCIGGVSRSLLGLLQKIPYTHYEVTLLLFSQTSQLFSQLPPQVQLIFCDDMSIKEAVRKCISQRLQNGPLRCLFPICKRMYHTLGRIFTVKGKTNTTFYDIAIAYQDGMATWYVAEQVCASRKIAFVHTDLLQAGYDMEHERKVYENFDQICFGSKGSRDRFLACLPEDAPRSAIVPNIVDKAAIQALAQSGQGFFDDFTGVRILTVGRLSHEKGCYKIPGIIQNLRSHHIPFKWYLIGDGPLRSTLEQGACEELVLLGVQLNPYPFFQQCDLYVQPSDYEGYCIALAEARVFSKPAVVCDFSGAGDQLENGITGMITGFDEQSLYQGICTVLEQPELRDRFAKALSHKAEDELWQVDRWIESLLQKSN